MIWVQYITTGALSFSQIIVTGNRIYTTDDDIRRSVLNSDLARNLIKQDIRCIQKKIKNFSWIQQVSVRKQWPDKLKIHIIEYTPVAYWNHIHMITKDSVVFFAPKGYSKKDLFPLLFGPLGSERVVLTSYYVFSEILKFSSVKIKSISMDHRCSWTIMLDDGLKLLLGREGNVVRLQRFMKVYPIFLKKYINKKDESIAYIDLRYKSGFSVKRN